MVHAVTAAASSTATEIGSVPFEARVDAWVLLLGIGLGYLWACRALGPRLRTFNPTELPALRRRFFAGLTILAVAVSWPIDTIGDGYLFSIHMVQYLVISLAAAPLLIAGTPGWLLVALTDPFRPIMRRLTHPVATLAGFNAVLVLSHWPALVDAYLRIDIVHFGMHALWVTAALLFWIPILNRAPGEFRKLAPPLQMGYLFLSSIIPTVPASFLTWAETPLFSEYTNAPRLWGVTPVQDLQAAGAVMKLGGGIALWTMIVVIFFRWAATQRDGNVRRVVSTST